MQYRHIAVAAAALISFGLTSQLCSAAPVKAMSTEGFLNRLGVNTHLNGLTAGDPWDTDPGQVATELTFLGVRLDRDWAWAAKDGAVWKKVQDGWPLGKFWTSVDEASPTNQRADLKTEETIFTTYPGLIYAMGGPNEEDDTYAQSQGATLPDACLVQSMLYTWAHADGRSIPVSQMEFGAGWTASNNWQGDYNPTNTGLHQNYTPGPADFASAHTYLSDPRHRPIDILNQLRSDALMSTPGKSVAHTEFGGYKGAKLSTAQFGQYVVLGAFDSASMGDAAYLVYGLQDSAPEQCFGFYTYPGRVPHEAAQYYHVMTTLLFSPSGRYGPGAHPTFTPGAIDVSYANASNGHLVLQKPTGKYVVAVWSEQLIDGTQHASTDTITFGHKVERTRVYDVEQGVAPIKTLSGTNHCDLALTPNDLYLIVVDNGF